MGGEIGGTEEEEEGGGGEKLVVGLVEEGLAEGDWSGAGDESGKRGGCHGWSWCWWSEQEEKGKDAKKNVRPSFS